MGSFTMRHGPYIAEIEYDDADAMFHGVVMNMRDTIHFSADSVAGLKREFAKSVKEYTQFCADERIEPQKPYSGHIPLRIPPELHSQLDAQARLMGKSLNAYLGEALHRLAEARGAPPRRD